LSELQGTASDPVRQGGQAAAAVAQIERRAALLPAPIAQWVLGVGRTSSDLSLSNARQQLGEAWRNGPGPLCQRATTNRFPFVPRAQAETPLGDFGRLFGPGGALDAFFTEHLQGLVDTSRSPWTARAGGPDAFRLPADVIAQFERAAAIRAALFQDGGSRPAVGFSLALAELGPATKAAQIELDGRPLRFAPGDREAHRLRWPGAEGSGAATLSFDGGEGLGAAFATRGAWSLFRLLAAGELRPLGQDSMQLRLAAGPSQANVILTPDNLQNPFDPVLFTRFRCPAIR
jgi:type VI secretion system protein ImpL